MSEKVKLPREVGNALDNISRMDAYKLRLLEALLHPNVKLSPDMEIVDQWADQESNNFEILLQALVNGYEAEQSPEDKVRELYKIVPPNRVWNPYEADQLGAYRNGIIDVLDALNIKIEGVNTP